MTCTIWRALTEPQRDELREWAVTGLVRMFERGEVGFEFLCDIQDWAGVGG